MTAHRGKGARTEKPPREKVIIAYADVGSHGGIFQFDGGPVYSAYGPLLHIWGEKISADLIEVEIRIKRGGR